MDPSISFVLQIPSDIDVNIAWNMVCTIYRDTGDIYIQICYIYYSCTFKIYCICIQSDVTSILCNFISNNMCSKTIYVMDIIQLVQDFFHQSGKSLPLSPEVQHIARYLASIFHVPGTTLPVIHGGDMGPLQMEEKKWVSGIITPKNGLINGYLWLYKPNYSIIGL